MATKDEVRDGIIEAVSIMLHDPKTRKALKALLGDNIEPCDECDGFGAVDTDCTACKGKPPQYECRSCGNSGYTSKACSKCKGIGYRKLD